MSKGLYFYKLVSPYEEDVTKNCKLTVNEIDSNFLNLKDYDIEKAELDEDNLAVVLTRKDGDKLVVDLTPILSGSVYDLEVVYENASGECSGASVYVSYKMLTEDDEMVSIKVPIKGLVTTDNINAIVDDKFKLEVISDSTLTGKGTIDSPLGVSKTELNRPAIKVIDKTVGEELPETPKRGDKYVTKEYVSEYGYLYDYDRGVAKIKEELELEGHGWRIPTKEDWDCLLNSLEPCEYQNHNSAACHQWLGKYAGKKLKSTCGWNCCPQEDCKCLNTVPYPGQHCETDEIESNEEIINDDEYIDEETVLEPDVEPQEIEIPDYCGTDEFGFRVMPTGTFDGKEMFQYFGSMAGFWTDSHVKLCSPYGDISIDDQDIYVKEFDCKKTGVYQQAICPDAYYAIRLVKDYTGWNSFDTETIDGHNYRTILAPECKLIWTASNFASDKYGYVVPNGGFVPDERVVYFINVWNGKDWEKREMVEGESIVIMDGNEHCQYNIEYRVYTADECNQELVNVDDTVVQRVLDRVIPLIDEERERAISAETELAEAISSETEARIAADEVLQQEIEDEVNRAQQVEQELWDAINAEAEAREEVDQQLWDAINQEASARTEVDNQLWDAIAQEYSARTEVDNQLWDAIAKEAAAREEVDNQQWSAITEEARIREEIDNQQWAAIEEEARIREEIDNQQWDAINAEIARAKAEEERIECQIIDNPNDPMNDETPTQTAEIDGVKYFVLRANGGLTLVSKCGTNNIPIRLDSDFGTF